MTHAQKLRAMSTALGIIALGVLVWIVVQAAMATNAAAAHEERDRWCTVTGVPTFECFDSVHDAAFDAR